MIRRQFFEEKDNGYAKVAYKDVFDQTWKKILAYEKKTNQSLDDGFTKEQYIDLLNSMDILRTSRFHNHKGSIMYYVKYLIEKNALPKDQKDILASVSINDININQDARYYKDLDDLYSSIRVAIGLTSPYDETRLDRAAVILYLAWYGLTEEQIINFLREDVLNDGIMINGTKIKVPFCVLQIFRRVRDTDGYTRQAKGDQFIQYAPSKYLIRTEYSEKIDISKMRQMLSRLNAQQDKSRPLMYKNVYQSGIFHRAYLTECESDSFNLKDPSFASKIFCEDLSAPYKRRFRVRDYKLYKQLFYQ